MPVCADILRFLRFYRTGVKVSGSIIQRWDIPHDYILDSVILFSNRNL